MQDVNTKHQTKRKHFQLIISYYLWLVQIQSVCVVSVTNTNVGLDHFYYISRDTKSSVLRYMSRTYYKSVLWKHHH